MSTGTVKCEGAAQFRLRVVSCMLSCRRLVISKIREDDRNPGISDVESSFLRLVEKIVNGASFSINDTGTKVAVSPGLIVGGEIKHDCGTARGIGYFIEGILPLLPFCKSTLLAEFTGVTNDNLDISVDRLKYSTLEIFRYFGVEEGKFNLDIIYRGAQPGGGGKVRMRFVPVRSLQPVHLVQFGMIKRIRGYAYATKVSPQFCNRMITSARALLNEFIPDVHVVSDHSRGAASGKSPGYAICLVAETTEQNYLSTEVTASKGQLPEDVGRLCSQYLLEEVAAGGCVDATHQPLLFTLMALTTEDVSKVRIGKLTGQSIVTLRALKKFLNVKFMIKPDLEVGGVVLSCVGSGITNVSKKVT